MAFNKVSFILGLLVHLIGQASGTVSCQFDTGSCGWAVVGTSVYSWRTHSGQTLDRSSGPLNDVTCKNFNGRYMYLPGIYSKKDETAILESQAVTLSNTSWISFWYNMNGEGIGSMALIQRLANGTEFELWSKHGEQKQGWQRTRVQIGAGEFSLMFQGSVRLPTGSDIAIDDVILESENTVFNTSHCSRTTPVPSITVPATTSTTTPRSRPTTPMKPTTTRPTPPSTTTPTLTQAALAECGIIDPKATSTHLSGSCDFEHGICDLAVHRDRSNNGVTWSITDKRDYAGSKYSISEDHTFEHTSHHGHYLDFQYSWAFFDKNPNGKNKASVETPFLNNTDVCLSFWHIMVTKDANMLVYVKDRNGTQTNVWSSNSTTPQWTNIALHIVHTPPFKIGFLSRNKEYFAKLALDDIVIIPVPNITVTSSPSPTSSIDITTQTGTSMETSNTTSITQTSVTSTIETTITQSKSTLSVTNSSVISTATVVPSKVTHSALGTSQQFLSSFLPSQATSASTSAKTKQPTQTTTKKNVIISGNGKDDKQTSHRFRNSSTVVGFSVGGLVLVTVIAVAAYAIRQSLRNKRFARRQRNILKAMENGHTNEGYTGLTSLTNSNGKHVIQNGHAQNGVKRNGHAQNGVKKNGHAQNGFKPNGHAQNGVKYATYVSEGMSSGNGLVSELSPANGKNRSIPSDTGSELVSNDSFLHSNTVNETNVITRF